MVFSYDNSSIVSSDQQPPVMSAWLPLINFIHPIIHQHRHQHRSVRPLSATLDNLSIATAASLLYHNTQVVEVF